MRVGGPDQSPTPVAPAARPPAIPLDGSSVVEDAWLGRIASADGLFVVDERQRIVAWSSAAQRLLGYSPEEVAGRPCYLVLTGREPDGHPVCKRNCQVTVNARRGRGTASYEVAACSREGAVKYVSISVLVLKGLAKSFRVLHLFHDVNTRPVSERRPAPSIFGARARRTPAAERLTRRGSGLRLFAAGSTTRNRSRARHQRVHRRNHIASISGSWVREQDRAARNARRAHRPADRALPGRYASAARRPPRRPPRTARRPVSTRQPPHAGLHAPLRLAWDGSPAPCLVGARPHSSPRT